MHDCLDANFLLDQERERLVAHFRRRTRTVRNIYRVYANRFEKSSPLDFFADVDAFRGNDLYHGHELAPAKLRSKKRPALQGRGRDNCGSRMTSRHVS